MLKKIYYLILAPLIVTDWSKQNEALNSASVDVWWEGLQSASARLFEFRMEYVVDLQGSKQPVNDFVLKELALLPLDEKSEPLVLMFREPYPSRQSTNKYRLENTQLERCYHGLAWKSGDVLYTDVGKIIRDLCTMWRRYFSRVELGKSDWEASRLMLRHYKVRLSRFWHAWEGDDCLHQSQYGIQSCVQFTMSS